METRFISLPHKFRISLTLVALFIGLAMVIGARPTQAQSPYTVPRVNVPHTNTVPDDLPSPHAPLSTLDGNFYDKITFPDGGMFWLGDVDKINNYTDVRLKYNDDHLYVRVNVNDEFLFCNVQEDYNCTNLNPTAWDAVTLYINTDLAPSNALGNNSYRFIRQFTHEWMDPVYYQHSFESTGSGWAAATLDFHSLSHYRGVGNFNSGQASHGWWAAFEIPFSTLGISGKPGNGTVWQVAMAVHDRDNSTGTPAISDKVWPADVNLNNPTTWGQLHFGQADPYTSPPTFGQQTVSIIHDPDNGMNFEDTHVGGHANCAAHVDPFYHVGTDMFRDFGSVNFGAADFDFFNQQTGNQETISRSHLNVQGQEDVADWNCQSKIYIEVDLDPVPAGKQIVSASLELNMFGNAGGAGWAVPPDTSYIQAFSAMEDWDENTVTWNNAPYAAENISGTWVVPLDAEEFPNNYTHIPVKYEWDVGKIVAQAYATGEPARIILYSADVARHSGKYFWSSMENAPERIPKLHITYGETNPPQFETFFPILIR